MKEEKWQRRNSMFHRLWCCWYNIQQTKFRPNNEKQPNLQTVQLRFCQSSRPVARLAMHPNNSTALRRLHVAREPNPSPSCGNDPQVGFIIPHALRWKHVMCCSYGDPSHTGNPYHGIPCDTINLSWWTYDHPRIWVYIPSFEHEFNTMKTIVNPVVNQLSQLGHHIVTPICK